MYSRILVLFFFILVAPFVQAQQYWLQTGGGVGNDEGTDVAADASGDVYSCGYFSVGATFGSISPSNSGITDAYLAKIDNTSGAYLWVNRGGGPGSDRALSTCTDASGNSYITGFYEGTATFGAQSITAAGSQDMFVAKYDATGNLLWVRSGGGPLADAGNGIAADAAGNVIVTGEFSGTANFGTASLSSLNGSMDVFTVKYDAAGNVLWAEKGSSRQTDRGFGVSTDAAGNIFITGQFSDTITFDLPHNNVSQNAVFVVKYDPAGNEQWFRRIAGGGFNIANGIHTDNSGNVLLTGDFQGTINIYLPSSSPTLSGTYLEHIFLLRFNNSGGLDWSVAASSYSPVTSRSVTSDAAGNYYIAGTFRCTMEQYSQQYGNSTFRTVGYSDVFVAGYNSTGAWQWSRQLGGQGNDYVGGIDISGASQVALSGSFPSRLHVPVNPANYIAVATSPASNVAAPAPFCTDANYNIYETAVTAGSSDVFAGLPIDLSRQPYDFYYHNPPTGCNRDTLPLCIRNDLLGYDCLGDTFYVCESNTPLFLGAATQTMNTATTGGGIGPAWTYQWSPGPSTPTMPVYNTGTYSLTITSPDGCYTDSDNAHVIVTPAPPLPTITDGVSINVNDSITTPVVICADSVLLSAGNLGNYQYSWNTPSGPVSASSFYATQDGLYTITVTDTAGCESSTLVNVTLDEPLSVINDTMILVLDTDGNDSIAICDDVFVELFIYDLITNPTGSQQLCIEDALNTIWTFTPTTGITLVSAAPCTGTFDVDSTGTYTFTAQFIRANACDTDTIVMVKQYYIEIYPDPGNVVLPAAINGTTSICPGDSTLLVATGLPAYQWSSGQTNDSIWVSQPGFYSVQYFSSVTNQYGCTGTTIGFAGVTVTIRPIPIITMLPSNGLICPGDSVQLFCTGTGNFTWYGPNGILPVNDSIIYVTSGGNYYCVNSGVGSDTCELVSNTVSVVQYNTPFLQATPDDVLCPGETVTLNVVASGATQIQWQFPFSGSATSQQVTQPGTYSCFVTSCNITTLTSATIDASYVSAQALWIGPDPVCEGDSTLLIANSNATYNYNWLPGNLGNNDSVFVYATGTYVVAITDTLNCTAFDTLQVAFQQNTLVAPDVSTLPVCIGLVATIQAQGNGGVVWYNTAGQQVGVGSPFTTGPLFTDTTLIAYVEAGACRSAASPILVDVEECDLNAPNVFTPDGDGINDFFTVYIPYGEDLRIEIYNRWGQLLNVVTDVNAGWDGTVMQTGGPASDGVYYYIASATVPGSGPVTLTGFLHLIRGGR
ncbi:MAG: gliding motility-associated C-terminal domain-containing protein [Bacteroidia bacterium]|jgi:gliding motility-associated-like protein|nr:gliding motility-associated C-terminal domain-containing protein [Bacteroidia bacterium]